MVRHPGTTGMKIVGADMRIAKLALGGTAWRGQSTGPATLRVHDGVDLQELELASGNEHSGSTPGTIEVGARWRPMCARRS